MNDSSVGYIPTCRRRGSPHSVVGDGGVLLLMKIHKIASSCVGTPMKEECSIAAAAVPSVSLASFYSTLAGMHCEVPLAQAPP